MFKLRPDPAQKIRARLFLATDAILCIVRAILSTEQIIASSHGVGIKVLSVAISSALGATTLLGAWLTSKGTNAGERFAIGALSLVIASVGIELCCALQGADYSDLSTAFLAAPLRLAWAVLYMFVVLFVRYRWTAE